MGYVPPIHCGDCSYWLAWFGWGFQSSNVDTVPEMDWMFTGELSCLLRFYSYRSIVSKSSHPDSVSSWGSSAYLRAVQETTLATSGLRMFSLAVVGDDVAYCLLTSTASMTSYALCLLSVLSGGKGLNPVQGRRSIDIAVPPDGVGRQQSLLLS